MKRYRLVLQWPFSTIEDYDAMIAIEKDLIARLSLKTSKVDGHDAGTGEMNVFIWTDDPVKAFAETQAVLEGHDLGKAVRAAYRKIDEDEYTILWPHDLKTFDVT